jgi:hypothetical protein
VTPRRLSVARAASLALNPSAWGGAFVAFVALRLEPPGTERWVAAGLGFAAVAAVPIGVLFVLKAVARLDDVEMRNRSQRGVVYLACAGSYAAGAATLAAIGSSWPVWGLVAVQAPEALALAVVNRHWKVSIHAAGLSGMVAAALVLFGACGFALAPVAVAGAGARWAAGAHGSVELALGAAIGFCLTWGGLCALRLIVAG